MTVPLSLAAWLATGPSFTAKSAIGTPAFITRRISYMVSTSGCHIQSKRMAIAGGVIMPNYNKHEVASHIDLLKAQMAVVEDGTVKLRVKIAQLEESIRYGEAVLKKQAEFLKQLEDLYESLD